MDHFARLGLAVSFALDGAALHKAYIAAQREAHPDRQSNPAARLAAIQRSADVNAAYRVLKDPLLRAEYLLRLEGVEMGGETSTLAPSQALLLESLDLRERLMEEGPTAALVSEAEAGLTICEADFEQAYGEAAYEKAARCTQRWRFMRKFREEIRTMTSTAS